MLEGTQNPAPLFVYTGGFAPHGNAPTFMHMTTANLDTYMDKKNRRRVLEKVGLYDVCKPIGKGNFAIVRLARHRIAKCKASFFTAYYHVAIKIVDKHSIDKDNLLKIEREIRILKTLEHPHIIKLYEVMRSEQFIYIVTEFAPNGELFELLAARGKLSEAESRVFFQQIVSALAYCHHRGIVHRDIKAENILIDKDKNIKLIDFGFSNIQKPKVLMSTWCGSPPYAAPELLLGRVYDGTKADIWSLGVVLFIMVTGGFPFAGDNLEKLKSNVVAGQLKIPFWVSPDCYDLLRKMILIPPERRLAIDAVAQHRWTVVEMPEKLRKLLKEEPLDRLLPDNPSFQLNKSICYCMHRDGNWSEAQIAEEVMRKNYESPIYATYELFYAKLKGKSDFEEPTDVAQQPRRGSRGSITTGKANIDDEPPAPTISARSLAILGLSDSDEGSDGDFEKDDFTLSPAESWLRHAAQLGPVAGVDEPNTSFSRAEARRHTLVGTSELDNLFALQQQVSDRDSLAAAFMAVNQAAVAAYASKFVNPFLLPTSNMLMQDPLSHYNRILTLPSCERRASAGDPSKFMNPGQITDQLLNAAMDVDGLFSFNPGGPSTSNAAAMAAAAAASVNAAAQNLHPGGLGNLTAEEEGEIYLKRFGHSKRNTFHCLGGSPGNSSGLSSARRGPYTRQIVPHERRSSWTSTQQNFSGQQQAHFEGLYRQSVGGGDQATTNIQQLQKEFKELNACFQAQGQAFGQKPMDTPMQPTCPPMISITDENNCVQLPVPSSFLNQDPSKNQENQPFERDDVSEEPHPGPSSERALKLMPPSENSTLISYLDTDIVLQQLRNTLDNLDIAYRETGYENHRICVENGVKSRIEIDVFPVPLSISQAKSRIEFSCTGVDTTGCGELCTELIKKLRICT